MADILCKVCGEPWNSYGVTHKTDMEAWEAALFRKGAGCPCCKGETPAGKDPESIALESMRQIVFDGPDDPHAFPGMDPTQGDEIQGKRIPWVPPADTTVWTCSGCDGAVKVSGRTGETEWDGPWPYDRPVECEDGPALTVDTNDGGDRWCSRCVSRCIECGETIAIRDDRGDMYAAGASIPDPRDEYHATICMSCLENLPSCSACGYHVADDGSDVDSDGRCESCAPTVKCADCGETMFQDPPEGSRRAVELDCEDGTRDMFCPDCATQ